MILSPDADNLSERAQRDLVGLLRESARIFGRSRAERTRDEILSRCREVADGNGIGRDIQGSTTRRTLRFWPVPTFVLIYDAQTRLVIRILHGRRDIRNIVR